MWVHKIARKQGASSIRAYSITICIQTRLPAPSAPYQLSLIHLQWRIIYVRVLFMKSRGHILPWINNAVKILRTKSKALSWRHKQWKTLNHFSRGKEPHKTYLRQLNRNFKSNQHPNSKRFSTLSCFGHAHLTLSPANCASQDDVEQMLVRNRDIVSSHLACFCDDDA